MTWKSHAEIDSLSDSTNRDALPGEHHENRLRGVIREKIVLQATVRRCEQPIGVARDQLRNASLSLLPAYARNNCKSLVFIRLHA